MEPFVVIVQRSSFLRAFNGDMFAVQGTGTMVKLPYVREMFGNVLPIVGCSSEGDGLLCKFSNNGFTNFTYKLGNGVVNYPKTIHQGVVAVARRKVTQRNCQLRAYSDRGFLCEVWTNQDKPGLPTMTPRTTTATIRYHYGGTTDHPGLSVRPEPFRTIPAVLGMFKTAGMTNNNYFTPQDMFPVIILFLILFFQLLSQV